MGYGHRQLNNILVYLVVIHNQKEENIPLWITVIGVQKKFCPKKWILVTKKNSVTNNGYSWPRKNFVMGYGYRQPNNILIYLIVIHNQKEENIPLWIALVGAQKKFCQKNEYWWPKKNSVTNNGYSWPRKNFVMDYGYRQPNKNSRVRNGYVQLVKKCFSLIMVIGNQKQLSYIEWLSVNKKILSIM